MQPADAPIAECPLAPELRDHIGFVLAKAKDHLHGYMMETFQAFGMEGRQFGVLVLISRRGGFIRQTDIAAALRIDRTTAMHCIDELEAKKLVRRQPHPEDRRAHAVTITPAGLRVLEQMMPLLAEAEKRFLSCLSAKEQATLLDLLGRLVSAGAPS